MAGIEIRSGTFINGETNPRSASYGHREPQKLPVWLGDLYIHEINGEVVYNTPPLKIGDRGTVLKKGQVIYATPKFMKDQAIIEIIVT